jgi:hypothetical protein
MNEYYMHGGTHMVTRGQALEALRAGVAGEVEALRRQLGGVRGELAPWEARIAAAKSRLDVAAAERDLLLRQGAEAQQRLRVGPPRARAHAPQMRRRLEQCAARDCGSWVEVKSGMLVVVLLPDASVYMWVWACLCTMPWYYSCAGTCRHMPESVVHAMSCPSFK